MKVPALLAFSSINFWAVLCSLHIKKSSPFTPLIHQTVLSKSLNFDQNLVIEKADANVKNVFSDFDELAHNLVNNLKHDVKSEFERIKKQANKQEDEIEAWSVHRHKAFPKYAIRTKEKVELCDPDVKQVVGYLDADGRHFFFWFFESRHKPESDPLILWLNGGPGCSSLTGLLMELGPCRVDEGGSSTTRNKWSWNNKANIIFLDQPVNAGFSYSDGDEVSSTEEAAVDVYAFLQLFFNKYSKYEKAEFHVTGESYAGHYIPQIGHEISEQNSVVKIMNYDPEAKMVHINLKSLAIGNGLTDPLNQYEYYPDMACQNSYGPVLSDAECDEMRGKVGTCKSLVEACYNYQNRFACVPGSIYCNNALIAPVQKAGTNVYDVRKECEPDNPLCYGIIRDIEGYMNNGEVQKAINVDRPFKGCNMDVNLKFLMNGDWMKPFVRVLPDLLEKGIRILIYAGDADYICNWMGNKAWTLELDWYGKDGFNSAPDVHWTSKITKKPAGEYKTFDNLTFLRVFEAGHMVPYDQPEHSFEMIDHWINKGKKL
ncbi:hypothetical protein HK099_002526 [Clydaea vesicula]|uniref:Carboxypeptidase n=1 Tax=Clydaea vesicula TaxID=447962 RepID=A0AAD5Y0Q5_9FUNG|nr:hypothetical protein HK099_002526 [Clydaea vesicula]KAJ3389558.1 hypothetical protein HDU92_000979 [Lobulomyces angularis]